MDEELLNDIDFEMMKITGKQTPKCSYGSYIYEKLRPIVPHRNSQVTQEGEVADDSNNSKPA